MYPRALRILYPLVKLRHHGRRIRMFRWQKTQPSLLTPSHLHAIDCTDTRTLSTSHVYIFTPCSVNISLSFFSIKTPSLHSFGCPPFISLLCVYPHSYPTSVCPRSLRPRSTLMPFPLPKTLLGVSTLILLLCVGHVSASLFTSHKTSPKVLGFDFKKEINTPLANRLRKRQGTVTANITNEGIAYVLPTQKAKVLADSLCSYIFNMTIGTPGQAFSVQLDTGSSDIWIPAADSNICQKDQEDCQVLGQYDSSASSSYVDIAPTFQIQYQDNSAVAGDYINETLKFGDTVIKDMTMGLAYEGDRGFGIMGIGYNADESITSTDPKDVYPNIVSQLKAQGFIKTLSYSLWLNDLCTHCPSKARALADMDQIPRQARSCSEALTLPNTTATWSYFLCKVTMASTETSP